MAKEVGSERGGRSAAPKGQEYGERKGLDSLPVPPPKITQAPLKQSQSGPAKPKNFKG